MRISKAPLVLIAFAILSGCATIFTGTTQTIEVQAVDKNTNEPVAGVSCIIRDGEGLTHKVNGNPGSFLIKKGSGALVPTCKKEGYEQASYGVGEDFNNVAWVNVLFWPGFLVDIATGAIEEYPSHMTIIMEETPST